MAGVCVCLCVCLCVCMFVRVDVRVSEQWTKVDSSCMASLVDDDGDPVGTARISTDVVVASQDPK